MLEIIASQQASASQRFALLPDDVSTPEITIKLEEDGAQHRFVEKFVANARFEGAQLTTIDGVRADFEYGWGLVRASNTTPAIVIRFEAVNSDKLAQLQRDFKVQLLATDPSPTLPF